MNVPSMGSHVAPEIQRRRRLVRPSPQLVEQRSASLRSSGLRSGVAYLSQCLVTSAPLLLADLLGLCVAFTLAAGCVNFIWPSMTFRLHDAVMGGLSLLILQPVIGIAIGLYPAVGISSTNELRLTSLATSAWAAVVLVSHFSHESWAALPSRVVPICWLLALALVPAIRCIARGLACQFSWWGQPALIFGGGADAAQAYRCLLANADRGLRPLGTIDDIDAHWNDRHVDATWYLGPPQAAQSIAEKHRVFWGILTQGTHEAADMATTLDQHATVLPHLLVLVNARSPMRSWDGACDFGGLMGLRIDERLLLPTLRFVKRGLDIALTAIGAILLTPLLFALALGVKLTSPGPIFYNQERIGLAGRRFRAWKFRSMVLDADRVLAGYLREHPEMQEEWDQTHKLKRDPRVTRIGRLLRKTSLDELPQLWNVFRGEMSLVGPRPIVDAEIDKYGSAYGLYLRVLPGITGLWQVSGRNNTTYQERVRLDMSYVRNWSPWLDLCILARTIRVVFLAEGA